MTVAATSYVPIPMTVPLRRLANAEVVVDSSTRHKDYVGAPASPDCVTLRIYVFHIYYSLSHLFL